MAGSTPGEAKLSKTTMIGDTMKRTKLLTGTAFLLASGMVRAAEVMPPTGEADGPAALEEIVVTAERRDRSLQDVPISITAFSSDALARSNVTEAKDYLQFAPNIAFTEDGATGPRSVDIAIRGVGNIKSSDLVTTSSAIGFYIDELNVGTVANGTINPQLQDVERIEVLRGPQGTYFGRNALGGAVSISTNKPDDSHFSEVSASYASFDTWDVRGIANLPVTDRLFLRATYAHEESAGFVRNVNPDGTRDSGYIYDNARVAVRAEISDRLHADFSFTYTDERAGIDNTVPSGVIDGDTKQTLGRPDLVAISQGLGFYPHNQRYVNHNAPEYNDNRFAIANLRVGYDTDYFDIRSITGYLYSRNQRLFDQDNIAADLFNRVVDGRSDSYSQEIRLQSNLPGAFEWIVGAIAAKDSLDQFSNVYVGADTTYTDPQTGVTTRFLPPRFTPGFPLNLRNRTNDVESYGAFAEGTYKMDALSLTLGARYTRDKVEAGQFDVLASNVPLADASGQQTFDNFSPRAVLKYQIDPDIGVYASVSSGYKAGGVDINRSIVRDFKPEQLRNYEVGFKSQFLDNRLRLNGSLFYLDWKDIQVVTAFLADPNDISSSTQLTLNASSARSKGVELEVQGALTSALQAGFSAGYLDAKFGSFPDATVFGGGTFDLSGKRVPKSPRWSLGANLDYSFALGPAMSGFARAEGTYRSEIDGNLDSVAAPLQGLPAFPYVSPAYTVVNLRTGLDTGRFRLEGYVENLLEEEYFNGTFDHFGLSGFRLQPHPRTWGVRVTFQLDR